MANDPNRDVLPLKEDSCMDIIHSIIDPREHHLVCKLDRYQLEDKYLRLLDEANNLKKLSNCQEDKIKRLGTKLIRLAGNPRCGVTLDIANDRNKTSALEFENAKLKEKINVMRNQLLSHTMNGKLSSRSRNIHTRPSSGLITCRSESNRARTPSCQCIVEAQDDDVRNYSVQIEKLEAQKKNMTCRITELEKELSLYTAGSQREKIAENVEYIRVWRQMKQLNDKLIVAQDKNTALTTEINDLKTTLEQTTRNNQEIAAVLTSERTRIGEIDEQMLKVKNSQFTLREKDEQIRDLINEMKILQQHNNELLNLTSKYSQVELENIELRKKISEQMQDQQSLKTAFSNEQANITALQVTNEQLLTKLQGLQTNMDTLTNQLTFFSQDEKRKIKITTLLTTPTKAVNTEKENKSNKLSCVIPGQCKKCCETYEKITQLEKIVSNAKEEWKTSDKSAQTSVAVSMQEQGIMTTANDERKGLQSPLKQWKIDQETNGKNILSPEKMLKLLDQVQINTPLDASRIAQKENYTAMLDITQRHSDEKVSSRVLNNEPSPIQKNSQNKISYLENQNITLHKVLIILFELLQEYLSFNNINEIISLHNQTSAIMDPSTDANNNNLAVETIRDIKLNNHITDSKESFVYDDHVTACNNNYIMNTSNLYSESAKRSDCSCNRGQSNCIDAKSYSCVNCTSQSTVICTDIKSIYKKKSVATSNSMKDCSSMKDTFSKSFPVINENCRKSLYRDITNDFCKEKAVKMAKLSTSSLYPKFNLTYHWQEIKEPLFFGQRDKQKLPCRIKCLNDKLDLPVCPMKSFPLLITDRQGIIEIHISRLQLSTSAAKICQEEDICNLYIYISWDVWGEKTAYTSRMKCPNLNFNSSSVHRIVDLFAFFKNVLSENLIFRVNAVRQNDINYTLASAKVSIKDVLDYPQNKLHYIVPVSSVISCFFGVNFGQLSLWIRLSCNIDLVEDFKKQYGISSLQDYLHPPEIQEHTNDTSEKVVESLIDATTLKDRQGNLVSDNLKNHMRSVNSDSQHETENSDDEMNYLNSNSIQTQELSSPSNELDEISDEECESVRVKSGESETVADATKERKKNGTPKDSASMMEFKTLLMNAGSSTSLHEGSSSTTYDMNEVLSEKNWERYRQRSLLISARSNSLNTDTQDYRNDPSIICKLENDMITIEIVSISFFEGSSILQDDEIQMLYVEFSFLGYYGEDMETVSIKKPIMPNQEIIYNFSRKFRIDEKTHITERKKLHAMLTKSINPDVTFIVICEPLPEETEIKDCQEVGFAIFNIRDFAFGDGCKDISLPIKDNEDKVIGVLKIIVLGYDAIRQCLANVSVNEV